MKTTGKLLFHALTLVLCLSALQTIGNNNDKATQITKQDNIWHVLRDAFNPEFFTEIYQIEGDTTINGESWQILQYTTDSYDQDVQNWQTRLYLREADGQLFCTSPPDLTPKLYFDFTASVNDTLDLYCPLWEEFSKVTITNIDTINIRGVERKRFYSLIFVTEPDPVEFWVENTIWLEGIGPESGIYYGNPEPMPGSQYNLTCFHESDVMLYPDDDFANCYMATNIDNGDKLRELLAYPNPATDQITLQLPGVPASEIVIHNLEGKRMLSIAPGSHTDQIIIDVANLIPGIYLITVYSPVLATPLSFRFQR